MRGQIYSQIRHSTTCEDGESLLAYLTRKFSEEKVGTESLEQPDGHQGSSNSSEGALLACFTSVGILLCNCSLVCLLCLTCK